MRHFAGGQTRHDAVEQVCPRCCLRFCGIGGKQSSSVYAHCPPDPQQLLQFGLGSLWSKNDFRNESGDSASKQIDCPDLHTGGMERQGDPRKKKENPGLFVEENNQHEISASPMEDSKCSNIHLDERWESSKPHTRGEPAEQSKNNVDCPNVIEESNHDCTSICSLCTGVLQYLDVSEAIPESGSSILWSNLPRVEHDSDWRLVPSTDCKHLKAILESSEHLFSEYGLDVFVPENVALRDISMFRHLQANFPRLCQKNKFETNNCPATGIKAAAKLTIIGLLASLAGEFDE